MQAVVLDVDGLVGTHRQRLAQRVLGVLGTDGQHGDLGVVRFVGDLQRLLHRVLVELREQTVHVVTVDGQVIGEVPVASGVGHVLHSDNDPQAHAGFSYCIVISGLPSFRQHRRLKRPIPVGAARAPNEILLASTPSSCPLSKRFAL